MKVLSTRVEPTIDHRVREIANEAGQKPAVWLRELVEWAVAVHERRPDPVVAQFCRHPDSKRLGDLCIACGDPHAHAMAV